MKLRHIVAERRVNSNLASDSVHKSESRPVAISVEENTLELAVCHLKDIVLFVVLVENAAMRDTCWYILVFRVIGEVKPLHFINLLQEFGAVFQESA